MAHKKRSPIPVLLAISALLLIGGGAALLFFQPAAAQAITVNAQVISDSQIAQGEQIYTQSCAACHGANGEGQPNWKQPGPDGVFPAPPHDPSGHTWHHADTQLLEIIAKGGADFMDNSGMPGFAGQLSDDEMVAVLAYIKTFWGAKEMDFQTQVTQQASN